jgi:hypothetical protein
MENADLHERLTDATAEEIIGLVKAGKPITKRRIAERLDMGKTVWEHDVTFNACEFVGPVDASYAQFKQLVRFDGCVLLNGGTFDSARFDSDVWFGMELRLSEPKKTEDAARGTGLLLNDARFSGALDARRLHIGAHGSLVMERTTFESDVYFSSAEIAHANIQQVRFNKSVFFNDAKFGQRPAPNDMAPLTDRVLAFERCSVAGDLDCTAIRCFGESIWERTTVDGKADFARTVLFGLTSFRHCRFGHLWMSDSRVVSQLMLSGVRIAGDLGLDLMNRKEIGSWQYPPPAIKLDGASVEHNMWLDRSEFGHVSAIGLKVGLQASFNDATFHGNFICYEMAVEFGAFFRGATFFGEVDLRRIRIGGEAYFSGAIFHRGAAFDNSVARVISFAGETHDPNVERAPARFAGRLSFTAMECGYLALRGITAEASMTVKPAILLLMARIESSVTISGGPFDRISAQHASIAGELDVSGARIESQLDLLGANVGTLTLGDSSTLPPSVDFRACAYRAIKFDDAEKLLAVTGVQARQQPFDRQPFLTLANIMRNAGNDDAARNILIQKNRLEERAAQGLTKLRKLVWRCVALYGYSATLLFFWSAGIVAMSAWVLSGPNMFEPKPEKANDAVLVAYCARAIGLEKATYFALSQVLPTSLPSNTECQPLSKIVMSGYQIFGFAVPTIAQPLLAYLALLIVAWMFVPLIVAHYAGLLRRLDT